MEKNYMETLLAQIREKHAKECIRQEVSDHIQDQKQHYIADGMTEEQAEEKAVADMGDPVETGIALDTLHKPKPAWSALAMIAVLCTAGIILQYTIYSSSLSAMGSYFFEKQCLYSVIGFLVLCIVYLVDYTQIAKYSRFLCLGILLLSFLIGNTNTMHGYPQIDLFYCQIRMDLFFYLYLPLYGAVLHSFRRCRPHDLWKLALYTILPILSRIPASAFVRVHQYIHHLDFHALHCCVQRMDQQIVTFEDAWTNSDWVCCVLCTYIFESACVSTIPDTGMDEPGSFSNRCRICRFSHPPHYQHKPSYRQKYGTVQDWLTAGF